jgi:hypothetical protein
MIDLKSNKLLLFLAFMIIITTYLPIFSTYASIYVGKNLGVNTAWANLWFISLLLFSTRTFADKFFLFVVFFWIILVYLLWNTLWVNLNEWNRTMDKNSIFCILLSISLYTYYRVSREYDGLALLLKWTLLFIALTAIMSIYSATIDPMYVRTSYLFTKEEYLAISKLGGGGYGFSGALVCLFPMIVYYYRNSLKIPFPKPLILFFGILCFIAVIRMQIFANIILSVFAIIFSLFGSGRIRKSLIYAGIFLGLIILIPKNVYSDLFISTSRFFDTSLDVNYKLNDMGTFFQSMEVSDESSAGGRLERYPLLWEGFKANPITGFYNSDITLDISAGGHLFWMNKLTTYGILGFIPFILIFYFHIKRCIKQFDPEFTFYFLLSMFSGIGLGLMKTLAGMDFWIMFFFIIPGMYYLPLLKKGTSDIGKQN